MPYCPQCGAEYTDLVSQCHECGVALVEEPPVLQSAEPVEIPWAREVIFWFRDRFLAGLGYAAGAARILLAKPILLGLPLLVLLFNTAEMMAGQYPILESYRHAPYSMRWSRSASTWNELKVFLTPARVSRIAVRDSLQAFPFPIAGPGIDGSRALLETEMDRAHPEANRMLRTGFNLVLELLLAVPLVAWFRSGYYEVLRRRCAGSRKRRGSFAWR